MRSVDVQKSDRPRMPFLQRCLTYSTIDLDLFFDTSFLQIRSESPQRVGAAAPSRVAPRVNGYQTRTRRFGCGKNDGGAAHMAADLHHCCTRGDVSSGEKERLPLLYRHPSFDALDGFPCYGKSV